MNKLDNWNLVLNITGLLGLILIFLGCISNLCSTIEISTVKKPVFFLDSQSASNGTTVIKTVENAKLERWIIEKSECFNKNEMVTINIESNGLKTIEHKQHNHKIIGEF